MNCPLKGIQGGPLMGIQGAPIYSLQPPGIKSADTIRPQFRNSRAIFFLNLVQKSPSPGPPGLISLKLVQEIPLPRARSALGRRRRRRQGDFLNQFQRNQPWGTWGGGFLNQIRKNQPWKSRFLKILKSSREELIAETTV